MLILKSLVPIRCYTDSLMSTAGFGFCYSGAVLKNAVVTEAYVSGATNMTPANIEGAGELLVLPVV